MQYRPLLNAFYLLLEHFFFLYKCAPLWFLPASKVLFGDASWHKKLLNCLHSLTKVHEGGCGLTGPQSPVQDSFAWPLTPCDAAGSSYIKNQEPKLSLSLGWTGGCGVCDTLGDTPPATSLQLQIGSA